MPDKTLESLNSITYLVENLTKERDSLREQNATLLRENAMLRIGLEAFLAWNHTPDADSSGGLAWLARAMTQAEKILKGEYDAPPA
jgi:hypothetical protein